MSPFQNENRLKQQQDTDDIMNILLLNQPTNNRGDEAAHKSLMRALNDRLPNAKITVLFKNEPQSTVEQMRVANPQNSYINIRFPEYGAGLSKKWALRIGNPKLSMIHPVHYAFGKYIKEADFVVCAPGGICMGLFQEWGHIYALALALRYHKKIAYYSRSFGPFPVKTKWNKLFKKVSYELLDNFDFISIRDAKTMRLADQIGVSYVPSIDTAFLDTPRVQLPKSVKSLLGNNEYIVFVPNSLTWHAAFKNCNIDYINRFYTSILEMLLTKYKNTNIIMLPQLFNRDKNADELYFRQLKSLHDNDRIIVVPEKYGSDIQQTIISNAKLMIGARYHSVVFAINNQVPFVALSYEHKISGLLDILGLQKYLFNIEPLATEEINIDEAVVNIEQIIDRSKPSKEAKHKAQEIAKNCMNTFVQKYSWLNG